MVEQARLKWLESSQLVGNASSLHNAGRNARRVVEEARELIAGDLGVRPSAVIFTSGGTEANNLAIKGAYWKLAERDPARVICSTIEHHAVMDPVLWLGEHEGANVQWCEVDGFGFVSPDRIGQMLASQAMPTLVTVMWANNEIGTVQPIHEIAEVAHAAGALVHSDAVQALGSIPIDLTGIDLATISGHKVGGPVGVGALIADPSISLTPIVHGGGQERDVRSGTFDPAGIAAFAVAVHQAIADQPAHARRVAALRDELVRRVQQAIPEAVLNGAPMGANRLPGNAHFSFPECEGDALLMLLDAAGVYVSTGSACTSGIPEPSHVLLALGASTHGARSSLRFSLGRTSTLADVEALMAALPAAVDRARRAGSAVQR